LRAAQSLIIGMHPTKFTGNAKAAFLHGLATLALTAAHHVYGGLIYRTPWRLHGAVAVLPIGLVLLALHRAYEKHTAERRGRLAGYALALVVIVFPVLIIGAFEGFYNHVVKNVLFFAGASADLLARMFPSPTYEMPNDAVFEISGMLQVVPAWLAGGATVRLVADLLRAGRLTSRRRGAGDRIDPFEVLDVRNERISVPSTARFTHLQFRRFAGCPVCNLHLRSFEKRHADVEAAGIREVVLFHTPANDLVEHTSHLPFAIVPDPDLRLYRALGVESSPRAMLDPRAWLPIFRAIVAGTIALARRRAKLPAARPHGGRFGLPADFLLDHEGRIVACHYGDHAADQWSVDELLALAAAPRRAHTREALDDYPSDASS
jgi:peroxiredoxin